MKKIMRTILNKETITCACLTLIPVSFLLLLEYLQMYEIGFQTSDARMYLSIADNFLKTGHFIQTERSFVSGLVVPPGLPMILTVLRFFRFSVTGIIILQIALFCVSNVLLYSTEKRLNGRAGWAPVIYSMAYMRCWLRLGVILVEHYYLFLMCVGVWLIFHDHISLKKKLLFLNADGLMMFLVRPVLAPVYLSILTYTLYWCIKENEKKKAALVIAVPIIVLTVNMAVNYRETGELILLENYSGADMYTASKPNSPVTIEQSAQFMDDEILLGIVYDDSLSAQDRDRAFRALAENYIRENPGKYFVNAVLRFFELFLKAYAFATVYTLLGGVMLIQSGRVNPKIGILSLSVNIFMAMISSFAVPEARYSMVIWPLASLHGAFLTDQILRKLHYTLTGEQYEA